MYEDYRQQVLLELCKVIPDQQMLMLALGAVDKVSNNYKIETKIQNLVPHSQLTEETLKLYIASMRAEGKQKGTVQNLYYSLRKFFETVQIPVDMITTNDIRCYLYTVMQTVSDSCAEKTRQHINGFYRWAIEEEIIQKNPCEKIRTIKTERKEIKPLTDDEMDLLLASAETKYENALIRYMYATGARIQEVANTKVSDLDLAGKKVHLYGKGKKHRTALLSDDAVICIKQYLDSRGYESEMLFPNERGVEKHQITAKALRDKIHKMAKRAGISVNPHQIRHTTATNLQKYMPIQNISKYLGHENIETTMIYARVNDADLEQQYHEAMG